MHEDLIQSDKVFFFIKPGMPMGIQCLAVEILNLHILALPFADGFCRSPDPC